MAQRAKTAKPRLSAASRGQSRTRIAPPAVGPGPVQMPEQAPLLETLLNILRRRKRWIIPALILVPLIAGLLTSRQPDRYTGTASLLFRDAATDLLNQDTSYRDPSRIQATNEDLIKLPVVSERTAAILNTEPRARAEHGSPLTTKAVSDAITIDASSESDLVAIEAEAAKPFLAARMANVYGEQYIAFRQTSDRRQLQRAIDKARAGLEALPPAQQGGAAASSYQERLNNLETTQALLTGNAELVQRAEVPRDPSSPRPVRNIMIGLLLGGVLGLAMAGLRERIDRSIRTDEELEEIYGLPVLMRLPRSRKLDRSGTGMKDSADAEAFRILRANLRYFNVDGELRSVLVSSPTSGDGKSTVARGLATTMASLGDSVVLVEADLHKGVSPTLGLAPEHGLSSVLSGMPLSDAIERVFLEEDKSRQLSLLPSGPVPPNPVELLESARMGTLLVELESRFDVVIIDSPALAQVSDARPLVGQVSGVLVVSGLGHTTRDAAMDFRKQLHLLEGHAFGVVANFAETQRGGYYY